MKFLIYIVISIGMVFSTLAFSSDNEAPYVFQVRNQTGETLYLASVVSTSGQLKNQKSHKKLTGTSVVPIPSGETGSFQTGGKVEVSFALNNLKYACMFQVAGYPFGGQPIKLSKLHGPNCKSFIISNQLRYVVLGPSVPGKVKRHK